MVAKPAQTDERIALLLALLDESYDRKSWHGTNLRGSIRGVSAQAAARRTPASRHCIAELVTHCAYWKYTVRRRLLDQPRGAFPLTGSNWFPRAEPFDERAWKACVRLLADEHRQLREAVAGFDARRLTHVASGGKVPYGMLIRGAALHDVYHAGQIQLLKRAET